jgi:redox-sensitive bicupin YhaK (pirin superfamily)
MKVRKASDRGDLKIDWLKAKYSFSFGSYFDPAHMGFESLRVINNDIISPGKGFATHSHNNMEIITIVLSGELEHKDTLGNQEIIKPGEIQLMSAGSGISHSEFNPNPNKETELYQIWIETNQIDVEPRYDQFSYKDRVKDNSLILIGSPNSADGVAKIYQDVNLHLGSLNGGVSVDPPNKDAKYWLQVIQGKVEANGIELSKADGASFDKNELIKLEGIEKSEFLLFEFF